MFDFKDQVVIVTGGTRGIGFETAKAFAEAGAQVIIFGSRAETVEKAVARLDKMNLKVEGSFPDLNDFPALERVVAEIAEKYGHIDVLVNNAGIAANKKIGDTTADEFSQIFDLNVRAVFHMSKAVVPVMKRQNSGVILNTSSMVSIYGQPSGVGYPASKFAVNGLTKSLARELAPDGIRVNAVAPGVIKTDMIANLPKEQLEPLVATIPLGRVGDPRDIAHAFLFLASDYASYVTGEILQVDGGARS